MASSHPSVFIPEEIIEPLGLNVNRAAEVLAVRRATFSDLLNGKAALSPEMALRVGKAFGMSMDTLRRIQTWHHANAMRLLADTIPVQRYRSV